MRPVVYLFLAALSLGGFLAALCVAGCGSSNTNSSTYLRPKAEQNTQQQSFQRLVGPL